MKVTVKIEGRPFVVEVGDINTRPIIALVDGERFEVWPEGEAALEGKNAPPGEFARPLEGAGRPTGGASRLINAPIPGVIFSIAVQPGDDLTVGQEVCVLEAMKMKNTIRSPRVGRILAVKVAIGQHVAHGESLVEFDT